MQQVNEAGISQLDLTVEGGDVLSPHEPSEVTFDEVRYPARPRTLRPRGRLNCAEPTTPPTHLGEPVGTNPHYVGWLLESSMLADAQALARQFSAVGTMWQNPFARPDARAAIAMASVWFTAYPIAVITKPGCSLLGTLADDALWETLQRLGVNGIHSGPVKRAGGVRGWDSTLSVDGHFDRISTDIDPAFGTAEEFRTICEVAASHGGTVIDDIVPAHTGKGPDFRLAEMNVGEYPGIYHMVQIPPEHWHLLPEVPPGRDAVNLSVETEDVLHQAGYTVGRLQRVIFHEPGVKDTNWSVTAPVTGPDGVTRRWVYLHYFKQGQPSLNWLDPTFAALRLVTGDAVHSLSDLGSGGLRFDANGFLGVEKSAEGSPAWSEGHPLSGAANHLLASMVRKLGAFSFQELNLSMDDIAQMSATGADLSYDFINRPAYHHALATGDTEFLRLTMNEAARLGIDPVGLVHALQNHDELTYELIHFSVRHAERTFSFRGSALLGLELAQTIRSELRERLTGPAAPYNRIFTTNGIASTTASVVAASLGYSDLSLLTSADIARIQRAHLLLVMYNALQPGVFALSGWDLVGSVTVDPAALGDLLADGDTRWINRGAYDLMGYRPEVTESLARMPRARALYGSLPDQLASKGSFASGVQRILAVRSRWGIDTAEHLGLAECEQGSVLGMVQRLADGRLQLTVLNFGEFQVVAQLRHPALPAGAAISDAHSRLVGTTVEAGQVSVRLGPHAGACMIIASPR